MVASSRIRLCNERRGMTVKKLSEDPKIKCLYIVTRHFNVVLDD